MLMIRSDGQRRVTDGLTRSEHEGEQERGERRVSMDVTTAPTLAQARISNTTALSDGAMPPPPSAWAATETAPEVPPTKAPRSCATSFGPGVIRERIQAPTTGLSR